MRRSLLAISSLLSILLLPRGALAGERFILRANPELVGEVCADHGLRVVRHVGRSHLVVVEAPPAADVGALAERLRAESRIYDFEPAQRGRVIHDASTPAPAPDLPLETIDRSSVDFFGVAAWKGYVEQAAVARVGADAARVAGAGGDGVVVAVIDTGVDPSHPLLSGALLPGYDFTRDSAGASEWADLGAEQSGGVVPLQSGGVVPLQSGGVVPLQSGGVVPLQSGGVVPLQSVGLPSTFGHGTMVAGLIHLIAPDATILPLKVISEDGTGTTEDLIAAIYYAVDHGAKVINMSLSSDSREVKRAIQYATNRGVICLAAAGNQGRRTVVFPAALQRVLGVAATTMDDARASFSNYGPHLVSLAAPGENLISAYPGGGYGLGSGTSFSAAVASGAAAILAGAQPGMDYSDAEDAFRYSVFLGRDLGYGRIDIPSALAAAQAQVWVKPRRWLASPEEDQP